MAKPYLSVEQKRVINRVMSGAIRLWDVDLIKKAAESGADTQELLVKAIARKSPDMVTLALDHGAKPDILVKIGDGVHTPLFHFAHDNFHEGVMNTLLSRGISVDTPNLAGETAAYKAGRAGDFDKMRFYLKNGADLDTRVQEIFISAIRKSDLQAIEWAVSKGADINAKIKVSDNSTVTVMHLVYQSFREDVAEYFLAKGISIDAVNSSGDTVLMLAAKQADARKVAYFLKKGADPLHANHDGATALDEALAASEKADNITSMSMNTRLQGKQVLQLLLDQVKTDKAMPATPTLDRDIKVMRPIKTLPKSFDGPK